MVDLDFQANATKWLLGLRERPGADVPGLPTVLERGTAPSDEELHPSPLAEGLHVLPSTAAIQSAEFAIANTPAGQTHLRTALAGARKRFDFVIIDCAPSLGAAVISGLCAADAVFVPVPPAFLSLSGVRDLEDAVQRLRVGFKVATRVRGYTLFSVDGREGVSVATRQLLQKFAGEKLMDSEIRISTAGKQLPEKHLTAWDAGADPRGAEDYAAVLDEVLRRVGPARKEAR